MEDISTATLLTFVLADVVLLCGAALFAGLTLSIMGLDTLSLEIIGSAGEEPDKSYANQLLPIRKRGNQLLCTLILGNVMVNTLIAQITDKFVTGWVGTALSTALITLGGEIIPQATMAAHALRVGASSAPIVNFFLILFCPVCKPIALFLNWAIGDDPGQVYERNELKHLMRIHAREHLGRSGLDDGDINLMVGAMDLHEKTVADAMTKIGDVFMIEASQPITPTLLTQIWETGHSRIPIFRVNRESIVGLLYSKDLLLVRPEQHTTVNDLINFYPRSCLYTDETTSLIAILKEFQGGKSHMAIVRKVEKVPQSDPVYRISGVVTLDDVIEQLLHSDIKDEFDEKQLQHFHAHGDFDVRAQPLGILFETNRVSRRLATAKALAEDHLTAVARVCLDSFSIFENATLDQVFGLISQHGQIFEIKSAPNARSLPMGDKRNVWLYQDGCETDSFTLVISGTVQIVLVNDDNFITEIGAWGMLGIGALRGPTIPDFHARIVETTTVLQLRSSAVLSFVQS